MNKIAMNNKHFFNFSSLSQNDFPSIEQTN